MDSVSFNADVDAEVLFGLHSLSDAALVAKSPSNGSEESTQNVLDVEKEKTKMFDIIERANDMRHRIEVLVAEEKSLREEAARIEKVIAGNNGENGVVDSTQGKAKLLKTESK